MTQSEPQTIRHSVIAGTWYPGSAQELRQTVDRYLAQVNQPLIDGSLLGLITPHAGYAYSGQTAAHAYHQLQGRQRDTVVILGPSHREWVGDVAVSGEDAYQTPLGQVPLDREFIADLQQEIALHQVRRDREHSLEIQLPFLQRQLGEFRLVPVMLGASEPAVAQRLAQALSTVIRHRAKDTGKVLLVASSDLHHIENYQEVVRRDAPVVGAVDAYDLERLTPLLMAPGCTVCGRMPILTVLHAAQDLGADAVQVLDHTNSGDVTGQRGPGQYTVGYMAAAIYKAS
jgi:AmmeMemoRadiSam system protein B